MYTPFIFSFFSHQKQLMDQQQLIFNLQRKLAENMQETEAAHGKQKEIQELYARTEKNLQDLELKRSTSWINA